MATYYLIGGDNRYHTTTDATVRTALLAKGYTELTAAQYATFTAAFAVDKVAGSEEWADFADPDDLDPEATPSVWEDDED
jgi:hypothetical protein